MPESFIPYGKQTIEDDDIEAVVEVLKSDWLTQGPKIAEFEEAIAKRVGAKYAVAVATGTAALHCACFAAGVGEGDEVITSPISFSASGNCALFLGAKVKFADIKPDTYCMDPKKLEKAITPRTKAIIPVDFTGQPCDMDEINAIARKHNLIVIEDAAHALGATYKDRPVGSLTDMTIFSFHPVKHITTGEGGMVTTNDAQFAKKIKLFRTHGITNLDEDMLLTEQAADNENTFNNGEKSKTKAPWYYEMQALGFNYRITDMQCALGLSQLKKLDRFLKRRREIAALYDQAFSRSNKLIVPYQENDRQNTWHLYMVRLNPANLKKSRRKIFEELRAKKIGVHVHYIPIHFLPFYRDRFGYKRGDFPQAEKYYDTAITLPLYPAMSRRDCERVIEGLLSAVEEKVSVGV
ncbi:MAG TPA: UDP-4-amino-4,6-dideoxy-N-acetyl-beta-L-altrosamine transaminase [Candidatus Omnitrophota bacterium]|nr:UDP-4-amino-4,6-dideoxy-N-acetyl-beta-L-altrosamine transaminase [Candidatus Omnitrophota bacterium]